MFMPQYNNGEGWWDMWYNPVNYSRAVEIRNMLLRDPNIRRENVRIVYCYTKA